MLFEYRTERDPPVSDTMFVEGSVYGLAAVFTILLLAWPLLHRFLQVKYAIEFFHTSEPFRFCSGFRIHHSLDSLVAVQHRD